MTVTEIADEVFKILGDRGRQFWSQGDIEEIVKEGLRELSEQGLFKGRYNLLLIETQQFYTLPAGLIKILDAYDSEGLKWDVLQGQNPDNSRPYTIIVEDYENIYIPFPEDGKTLTIEYTKFADETGDIPLQNPDVLKYYALSKALIYDDEVNNQQKAAIYDAMYQKRLKELRDRAFKGYSAKPLTTSYQGF